MAKASIKGSAWRFGSQWGNRFIGLLSTVVLARVLTPADFGLVAIGAAVLALMDAMAQLPIGNYIVRAEKVTDDLLNSAFTLSVLRGLLLGLIMLGIAAFAPMLYPDPRLQPIFMVLAIPPVIDGIVNPRISEYDREMNFAVRTMRQLSSKMAGSLAIIAVAILFKTYWALIVGRFVRSIVWVGASHVTKRYRPKWSVAEGRGILQFSAWMTLQKFVEMIGKQGDRLMVGRAAGLAGLGSFGLAKDFAWITAAEFFAAAGEVLFPALTRFRDNPAHLRQNVIEATGLLTSIALPWCIGAALISPQAVFLLYGAKWEFAAQLATPIALGLAFQSTTTIANALTFSAGNVRDLLWRAGVVTGLSLGVVFVGLQYFDLLTAVWLLVPVSFVGAGINMSLIRKVSGATSRDLLSATWRSWVSVGAMATTVVAVGLHLPAEIDVLTLIYVILTKAVVGAATYAGTHLALWRLVGRPEGAEQRLLGIFGGILRRFR